ncbi:MAG: bifunctional hydroxymethylpyrimidine kinase/phosphomethylpyrimidine kinase [Bacteroidales bacterium]|nr:bifunctional hydroxymethylpyrimidine kinase/phosphomethylpyrimidine kinase [Bacteroidales bacterium]
MTKKAIAVLSIAGSDSCGGAGIQADIKTISALGLYACSCVTATTAQNTQEVKAVQATNADILSSQIDAVLEDFEIKAIKTGMIYTPENVLAIKESLMKNQYKNPLVLDPVLIATSGGKLAKEELLPCMERELFPLATLITPNLKEAEAIVGFKVEDTEEMQRAGAYIIEQFGAKNVLIKGGHLNGNEMIDVLVKEDGEVKMFSNEKIETKNTHGTGCTLSSAIACYLAMNIDVTVSVLNAKRYVSEAIYNAKDLELGKGNGSLNHLFFPKELIITE